MSTFEHTCPSGLTGEMKKWKVSDLAIFAKRAILRRPGPAIEAELAKRAWVQTTDQGIYTFEGKPHWTGDILQGDLFDVVRQARIATWGPDCSYDFKCEDPMCREKIPMTVPLDKMKVREMSDEAKAVWANDNEIRWTFPECGREVVYCLATAKTMALADKLSRQHGRSMHAIWASRCKSIEGVSSPGRFVDFLGDLDPLDGADFEDELDRLTPGVDTAVEMVCEECGLEQEQDMPFGANFFTPRAGKKKRASSDG
jgi:hypothetical protein